MTISIHLMVVGGQFCFNTGDEELSTCGQQVVSISVCLE